MHVYTFGIIPYPIKICHSVFKVAILPFLLRVCVGTERSDGPSWMKVQYAPSVHSDLTTIFNL